MLQNYPPLPAGAKRIITVVIVGVLMLVAGTALSAEKKERTPIAATAVNTQPAKRVKILTNNVLDATDGDVEFALNPKKMRVNQEKIGNGNNVRVAGAGKQFITIFLQIKNTGEKRISPRLADQVLITAKGNRVEPQKELQEYITNGDWYKSVSPRGHASGTLVYEVDADDRAEKLELRSHRKSEGASITLK